MVLGGWHSSISSQTCIRDHYVLYLLLYPSAGEDVRTSALEHAALASVFQHQVIYLAICIFRSLLQGSCFKTNQETKFSTNWVSFSRSISLQKLASPPKICNSCHFSWQNLRFSYRWDPCFCLLPCEIEDPLFQKSLTVITVSCAVWEQKALQA